jgi:S-adenosylmethionine decarboxylase
MSAPAGDGATMVGRHYLVDLAGCDPALLNDPERLRAALRAAAQAAGASLLGELFHHFSPHGVTLVGLLSESHVALHTWPEHGFAAFDFFLCSDSASVDAALAVLRETLRPDCVELRLVPRVRPARGGYPPGQL